ncbi:MAG TPA: aldo/keto reductase [bacterium]|nr:aldo/keto reductase [bacterium]
MEKRKLGRQGLEVSALGLGCMGMTFAYHQQAAEAECLRVLEAALERGMNFWDTAQSYGPFTNEQLLGKALKGKRGQVVLATKFGWKDGKASPENLDGSAQNTRESVEGCLRRLGTDYLDLLYLHRADPKRPIEETLGAMAALVKEGKVKYLGLSEVGPKTLRRAHAVHPLSALQSEYSLLETEIEAEILPTLRELGIGLVPFSPMGRGFLTGQIKSYEDLGERDMRRNLPRFQGENFRANLRLVEAVEGIAAPRQNTPGQIALAWLLQKGPDIVPIPGTTRLKHLEENAKAAEIKLTPDELKALDSILSQIKISGGRYNAVMAQMVNRD